MTDPLIEAEPGEKFESLWARFETESGFGISAFESEKATIEAEIIRLEAQIEKQRQQLNSLATRQEVAKQQMRALLSAGLTPDAVLSAMRVQYRGPKTTTAASREAPAAPVTQEDKDIVLKALTTEPATPGDIRKRLSRDLPHLPNVLKVLVSDGLAVKVGERRATRYGLPGDGTAAKPADEAPRAPIALGASNSGSEADVDAEDIDELDE